MLYTGLDLCKSCSYITVTNDRGEFIGQKKMSSNGEILGFLKLWALGYGKFSLAIPLATSFIVLRIPMTAR